MEFFLYGATLGMDEAEYRNLVGEEILDEPGDRIALVEIEHNDDYFVAEVGKHLQIKQGGPKKHDSAVIRAIRPGAVLRVYTTARQVDGEEGQSAWANPFLIGMPSVHSITTFSELDDV